MRKPVRIAALAVAVSVVATLAGCSSGTSSDSSSQSGPITLTYWGGNNTDKLAALWNKTHPDIQVKSQIVASGATTTTKVLTAIKAGSGAPDVVGAEYTTIPTLVAAGALTDLSKYGASSLKSKFASSYWTSVTLGSSAVYGVPTDAGPEMLFYRKDVFDKLGLSAPTTWAEYAADAKKIHDADPKQYIGTFDGTGATWFAGLTQQAGDSWWGKDGDAWTVGINGAGSRKVTDYWSNLVKQDLVDTIPMFSPQWNAALNNGTQVAWTGAAWSPGVLAGVAAKTKGKWAAAVLPQWSAGENADGNWGGGAQVVTSQSKHPKQALEFVKWLTTSKEGLTAFIDDVGIYPAANNTYGALSDPPAFLSDQKDFYSIASQALQSVTPVTYGPNTDVAYSSFSDAFGKAANSKDPASFTDALDTLQSDVKSNLSKSGYTVK